MNAIEPLADAVTGAVLANTVEPAAGLDSSGHTAERNCLNCAAPLIGNFCHSCGQKGHVHRTLGAFGHDLLHGVLHFEGKIFRTLPKLMLKPGELTRRYIAGERARFVSPLALFLFSVFTMFAVVSLLVSPMDIVSDSDRADASAQLATQKAEVEDKLRELHAERAEAAARGASVTSLNSRIRSEEIALDILNDLPAETAASGSAPRSASKFTPDGHPGAPSTMVKVGSAPALGFKQGSAFDRAYKAAKQNPGLLIYKLQTNAYKFSWALIVISVPFMALLFLWRWRPLYDHAVFVTYSITAVSILVILGSLLVLAGLPTGAIITVTSLFIPWHIYRQLRGGYGLRRSSALWRTLALVLFAILALGLFAFGLLMLGVLG